MDKQLLPSYTAMNNPTSRTQNNPSGQWRQDENGWWWDFGDGTYAQSEWLSIDNYWYYFNNTGYMVTGWCLVNSKWYFLNPGSIGGQPYGSMCTGIITINEDDFGFRNAGDLYYTKLGVSRVNEEYDNWCWIGAIKAIGDYVKPSNTKSQSDICRSVKGSIVNEGGTISECAEGLAYITEKDTTYANALSMSKTADLIMNYKPFVMGNIGTVNTQTVGHAIACIGYDEDTNELIYIDADKKDSASAIYVDYDKTIKGFQFAGSTVVFQYKNVAYIK